MYLLVFQYDYGDIIVQKAPAADSPFLVSQQRIRANSNDGQAWYMLYLCHSGGKWGAPCRNKSAAEICLQRAVALRYPDAINDMARLEEEKAARQSIADSDARRMEAANVMFANKESLESAIQREIYPCIVSIETASGYGTGFFQYSEWLISNAHVIPSKDVLAGASFTDYQSALIELNVDESYHRPCFASAPDLVIIKAKKPPESSNKCLPYTFSGDDSSGQTLFFYVNINSYTSSYEINYLHQLSHSSLPLVFACSEDKTPMPGASGAPIIEARVILDRTPQWQFKVVGALYARCSAAWYSTTFNDTAHYSESAKLVCAIPVKNDLLQILQLLFAKQSADRAGAMASAAASLHDEQAEHDRIKCLREQDVANQAVADGLKKFESGASPLCILLPDGLETLAGSGFFKPKDSYLKWYRGLSENEIYATFKDFIRRISTIPNLNISVTKETTILSEQYWRLDCKPGEDNQYWLLQLQDNTGKGSKVPGTKKSASSIFAEVKIPKNIRSINGQPLAMDLLKSHIKIERGEKYPTIKIDVSDGDAPVTALKMTQYKKTELSRADSLESLALFTALPAENYSDFSIVKKYAEDIDRINTVNEDGNTPLMHLLSDPGLAYQSEQIAKAKILAPWSIWNHKNSAGKTATEILLENPNKTADIEKLLPSYD
jgi:hypothetical protein